MDLAIARAGMEAVPETDALIREAADWLTARANRSGARMKPRTMSLCAWRKPANS